MVLQWMVYLLVLLRMFMEAFIKLLQLRQVIVAAYQHLKIESVISKVQTIGDSQSLIFQQ